MNFTDAQAAVRRMASEEPDARGVEWLSYSDRNEARAMPLPRSLAHLKREISEKK